MIPAAPPDDPVDRKSVGKSVLFGLAESDQSPEPEQLPDKVGLKKPRHPYELITEDDDDKRPVR